MPSRMIQWIRSNASGGDIIIKVHNARDVMEAQEAVNMLKEKECRRKSGFRGGNFEPG